MSLMKIFSETEKKENPEVWSQKGSLFYSPQALSKLDYFLATSHNAEPFYSQYI